MGHHSIIRRATEEVPIQPDEALWLLSSESDAIEMLSGAYELRKKYYGKTVRIHVLNNAQNGYCPEDCHYCVQAKPSTVPIETYTRKDEAQLLKEAENAHKKGAFRYCMVFSGRGPSKKRVEFLARVIKKIKARYPIEVCLSPGLISRDDAAQLAEAGLDRYNHNLNTSEAYYESICTTHTFKDRLDTLSNVHANNIDICSGMIVGMGESDTDIVDVAFKLKSLQVQSIPINFYLNVEGNMLGEQPPLSPEQCCKIVAMFRLVHPTAEIRLAAGREHYLKHLQPLALMAANSLFMDGYLNVKGDNIHDTITLIESSGFCVASDVDLSHLHHLANTANAVSAFNNQPSSAPSIQLKSLDDLQPV